MNLSQSKRAVTVRKWRVGDNEKKRFNTFLTSYVETKHNAIYNQGRELYNSLKRSHPEKKDLTKTKEFKRWKRQQQDETHEDHVETVSSSLQDETHEDHVETVSSSLQDETREDHVETASSSLQGETHEDHVETASSSLQDETHEDHVETDRPTPEDPPEIPEINDVDRIIDNIIQELNQDDDLHNIMHDELVQPHYIEDDEGIGLNLDIELDGIVEPFDYALEVEPYEW